MPFKFPARTRSERSERRKRRARKVPENGKEGRKQKISIENALKGAWGKRGPPSRALNEKKGQKRRRKPEDKEVLAQSPCEVEVRKAAHPPPQAAARAMKACKLMDQAWRRWKRGKTSGKLESGQAEASADGESQQPGRQMSFRINGSHSLQPPRLRP